MTKKGQVIKGNAFNCADAVNFPCPFTLQCSISIFHVLVPYKVKTL